MKRYNLSYYFVALLLVCLALPATADEARFHLIERQYTWNADGSADFRYRKELTLLTHTAMNRTYGETFITYNPAFQTLTINASYTKQKDGTIVRSPENAFVEVLPAAAANAPAFNGLREMVVVHTGLELGATIYLDYTIHTRSGALPLMEAEGVLQESSPVECSRLSFNLPGGATDDMLFINKGGKYGKASRKDGTLTWEFRNLPALSREAYRPDDHRDDVAFVFCAAAGNDKAPGILKERFAEEPSATVRHLADSLTREAKTAADKVKALRHFLASGLADCRIADALTGYTPRPSDEVIRTAYATGAERARLMTSLCRAIGIKAEVATVYPTHIAKAVRGLGTIKQWGVVWRDAKGANAFCDTQHPAARNADDRSALDVALTLDGKETALPAYVPQAEQTFKVNANRAHKVGNLYVLTLHAEGYGSAGWGLYSLPSSRETTIELPYKANEHVIYEVETGDSLRWLPGESQFRLSNACGEMTQTVKETANGGLRIERTLTLNSRTVAPKDYEKLRQLLMEWGDENRMTLVFEPK